MNYLAPMRVARNHPNAFNEDARLSRLIDVFGCKEFLQWANVKANILAGLWSAH